MFINQVRLKNYKSFLDSVVRINNFSVLVGANASGKSNFLEALKFLRDASQFGFSDAIALQGGMEFMPNRNSSGDIQLEYNFTGDSLGGYRLNSYLSVFSKGYVLQPAELRYTINISRDKKIPSVTQKAILSYEVYEVHDKKRSLAGGGRMTVVCKDDGNLSFRNDLAQRLKLKLHIGNEDVYKEFCSIYTFPKQSRTIWMKNFKQHPIVSRSGMVLDLVQLENISFYDFDPKLAKQSSKFAGKKELDENGGNFNVALNYVLENSENKRRFLNYLSDFLPFISNFNVGQGVDRSLMAIFTEHEGGLLKFPSYAMSDGTIYIACLILGVSFSSKNMIVIEEPEKYINPALSIKVIDYLKNSQRNKQILITSHSPQLIKYAEVDNIIIAKRDEKGSELLHAQEILQIGEYMKSDIELDQIFSENLLGL